MVVDGKGRIFEDRRGKNKPKEEKTNTSLKDKKTEPKKNRRKEDKK